MTEIIKNQPLIIEFRCNECNTHFRTDEWHIDVTPKNELNIFGYIHAVCPVCKNCITMKFGS